MSRIRRLLTRIILALFAPLLLIALLEGLCHLFNWGHPTRLLLSAEQDGRAVWIDNQLFGYRFFDPAVARAPTPIIVPVNKASDELRVVVLGESAAMGEPEPAYGPARMLEYQLAAYYTNRKIRVINAAMTAINSHVIREIARDLDRLKPDFVILYIGNNEVVGPYGPGTVFHVFSDSSALNRLRVMLTRLRLVSAIRTALFTAGGGDRTVWQGMEMFDKNRIRADDPRLKQVYDSFRDNVSAVIDTSVRAGAKPIINTIAVNLGDQAPLDGSEIGNDHGIEALKQQRDADTLRFRADSTINDLLRNLSRDFPKAGFIDTERVFEQVGIPGYGLFIDHVHFSFDGSFLLSSSWAEAMGAQPPLSREDMSRLLVWNPYNALDITEIMLERSSRPPFSGTVDHKDRMMHWTRERANMYRTALALPLDTVIDSFREARNRYPEDTYYIQQTIRALLTADRFHEAETWLDDLHAKIPHRADVRGWKAMFAALNGNRAAIWPAMTNGAPDLGELPADLQVSVSETLLKAGLREESLAVLEIAAGHFPNRLKLQTLLASRYAQAGKRDEASREFQLLVQSHPDQAKIGEEYGILLAMSGQPTEAEKLLLHLRDAADADSQLKWVQFLLFQQRVDDAVAYLQQMLSAHPGNGAVLRQLAHISKQRRDFPSAISWTEQWADAEPWQGEAWGQLGDWYDEADRVDDAVSAYERAIPLLTDPLSTQRALAWILATTGDPRHALELIEDVARLENPPFGYTHLVRATALAALGRHADAIEEIDQTLRKQTGLKDPGLLEQLQQARQLFEQGGTIRR